MTVSPELRAAAGRAADFLEANRDRHITGNFAIDARGIRVHPTDPAAECFCALGALVKEAGPLLPPPPPSYKAYSVWEQLWSVLDTNLVNKIYKTNDEDEDFRDLRVSGYARGAAGSAGIHILRRFANGELE